MRRVRERDFVEHIHAPGQIFESRADLDGSAGGSGLGTQWVNHVRRSFVRVVTHDC